MARKKGKSFTLSFPSDDPHTHPSFIEFIRRVLASDKAFISSWDRKLESDPMYHEKFGMILCMSWDSIKTVEGGRLGIIMESREFISNRELLLIFMGPQKLAQNKEKVVPSSVISERQGRLRKLQSSPFFEAIRSLYRGDNGAYINWITYPVDPIEDVLLNIEKYTLRELLYMSEMVVNPREISLVVPRKRDLQNLTIDLPMLAKLIIQELIWVHHLPCPSWCERDPRNHSYNPDLSHILTRKALPTTIKNYSITSSDSSLAFSGRSGSWFIPLFAEEYNVWENPDIFLVGYKKHKKGVDPIFWSVEFLIRSFREATKDPDAPEYQNKPLTTPSARHLHNFLETRCFPECIDELLTAIEIFLMERGNRKILGLLELCSLSQLEHLETVFQNIKSMATALSVRRDLSLLKISDRLGRITISLSPLELEVYNSLDICDTSEDGRYVLDFHREKVKDLLVSESSLYYSGPIETMSLYGYFRFPPSKSDDLQLILNRLVSTSSHYLELSSPKYLEKKGAHSL